MASAGDRKRPPPRDRAVAGLTYTGGTAYPGGDVPMVTLSGGVAARLAMSDLFG